MDVNAYYNPRFNQIILPVGALKYPLFDISLPRSLNFGAAGFYMGHELTHGFDNIGRQFDQNGELRQWWKNSTIERFNQRIKCLVDQYSAYKINGKYLDGEKTLGISTLNEIILN